MRSSRLLSFVLAVALLGLPGLVIGAGSASAAVVAATGITIDSAPVKQVYGGQLQVGGRLDYLDPTTGAATPAANQVLHLERRWKGTDAFAEIAALATDAGGVAVFDLTAGANADYRLRFDGGAQSADITLAASMSEQRTSKVMRDLGAKEPKDGTKRIVFKGNVNPGYGHKVVKLQRRTCKSCAWKAFDKEKTASNGSWSFVTPTPRNGSWYYRTVAKGNTAFVKSKSPILEVWRY
jgi:hypothetical protein